MKKINFEKLSNIYEYIIFDQWGVLHDGKRLFNFTNKSIRKLKNKHLTLISNTSQTLEEFKKQTLKKINLEFKYFNNIVTAGEALKQIKLKSKKNYISKILKKKKAFVISNNKEVDLLKKLRIEKIDCNNCKFILAMSLEPKKNINQIIRVIIKLSQKKIPMICTNPDLFTFKDNSRYFQIGYIAKIYEKLGGKVVYIGKPQRMIFNNLFKKIKKKKTVLIGDNLDTDIMGGKNFGIKTALVLDGFKKLNCFKSDNIALNEIHKKKIIPDYLIRNIKIN